MKKENLKLSEKQAGLIEDLVDIEVKLALRELVGMDAPLVLLEKRDVLRRLLSLREAKL